MDNKLRWDKETQDPYYGYDQGSEHLGADQGQHHLGYDLGGNGHDFSTGQAPGSNAAHSFHAASVPPPTQTPQAPAAGVPKKNDQLIYNYDPVHHYSRYQPKTTRNMLDLVGLIVLIVFSFMVAVHIPKYILVAMGYRKDPQEPDPASFVVLYIVFTLIFFPLIVVILAVPTGYYKYIAHKVKTLPAVIMGKKQSVV